MQTCQARRAGCFAVTKHILGSSDEMGEQSGEFGSEGIKGQLQNMTGLAWFEACVS